MLLQVSVTRPGPGGGGLVKNIAFHHVDVVAAFQDMRKTITTAEELREVRVSREPGDGLWVRLHHDLCGVCLYFVVYDFQVLPAC